LNYLIKNNNKSITNLSARLDRLSGGSGSTSDYVIKNIGKGSDVHEYWKGRKIVPLNEWKKIANTNYAFGHGVEHLRTKEAFKGYYNLHRRGIKIRWITDITKENITSEYLDPVWGQHGIVGGLERDHRIFKCDMSSIRDNLCIFHHPNFLTGNESQVSNEFNSKVDNLPSTKKLLCIGYLLPNISLKNRTFSSQVIFHNAVFNGPVDFSNSTFKIKSSFLGARFKGDASFYNTHFYGAIDFDDPEFESKSTLLKGIVFQGAIFENTAYFEKSHFEVGVDFTRTQFVKEAIFDESEFHGTSDFSHCKFLGEGRFIETDFSLAYVRFWNVLLKNPENIIFKPLKNNLTQVSFVNTDISRVRFDEHVRFGEKEYGRFKIIDDWQMEMSMDDTNFRAAAAIHPMGAILSVYRNLRENYEFRMRYDEAGEFFIREMEIRRRYKEHFEDGKVMISLNRWVVRNFSLTGLYYHLSRYGQSILRPTVFGIGIILLSTILWFTQSNAFGDFSISQITVFSQYDNLTHYQKSFDRAILNFIPLLPAGTGIKLGLIDYAFKIIGGAVTFGLIIIALRRKFERKFRH
jgi:uncharacterized protein YjbI with pentapeptide repeats